ncbi:MAG: Asp-tRNA(Asn)/Glu-tRNA(Gln) amidotransferase subunit GatA [Caldisericaceae bacterium]
MDIVDLSLKETVDLVKKGELKAVEVVSSYLDVISRVDKDINAFISVFYDEALEEAKKKDETRDKVGSLFGSVVAVKDNILVKDHEATCGSTILKGFISPYDATVIRKLKEAGAIIIGKTNLDEFAMGSSTENSAFFTTKNPVNTDYVPGGSSGGSAASVKAKETLFALGSDTGGSVRQPASYCGVVGLKPTYGRVSRYGLVAFASSLDVIGPIGRTVQDVAMVLSSIAGFDEQDETTVDKEVLDYANFLDSKIQGKRIGIIKEVMEANIQEEVKDALNAAIKSLNSLGFDIIEVSIPHLNYALSVYYLIAPSEASANLARYDGIRYGFLEDQGENLREFYENIRTVGFGREVKRRILLGTFALSEGYFDEYYLKASKVRRIIYEEFKDVFDTVDAILTPTAPTTAFKFGEKVSPLEMYMSDIFTIPANLAYLPAISVPFKEDKKGLPIGIQLISKWFDEKNLLNIAYALERSR